MLEVMAYSSNDLKIKRKRQDILLKYCSWITILVASTVLFGWIIDYKFILSLIPKAATMKANTALNFIFIGCIGLILKSNSRYQRSLINILATLIALVALITIIEYDFGVSFMIDSLIVEDNYSSITKNRMSPGTAMCFFLTVIGVLTFHSKRDFFSQIPRYIWILITIVSLISIATFILGVQPQQKTEIFSSMAIHTSALFFLMSISFYSQTSKAVIERPDF